MRSTFFIPAVKIKLFQDLVKQHDLRFVGNPIVFGERAQVCVDAEHLAPGAANPFFQEWERLNTSIVEIKRSFWQLKLKALKKLLTL
jgi:hypothetical protein